MNQENHIDKPSVYLFAGLISACGIMMLNLLPVLVGAMAEEFGFSESQLGDIIAGYNLAFTVIAVSALFWIRSVNWRFVSMIGIVIAAAAYLAMMTVASFQMVLGLAVIIGLALGALYALIMVLLGDSNDPDRAYGIKLSLETIPGGFLLFIIPTLIAPTFGFAGVMITTASALILLGLSSFGLPKQGREHNNIATNKTVDSRYALSFISLLASLAYVAGIVATWAFLELLGAKNGLSGDEIGGALSIGFLVFGGGGGFIAAFVAERFGRILPFVLAVTVNLLGLFYFSSLNDSSHFTIACYLFLFSLNFGLTYTFGLTAMVDSTGKLAALSAAVLSVGAIVGPFISGRLVEANGFDAMLMFSAIATVFSLICYVFVVLRDKKHQVIAY